MLTIGNDRREISYVIKTPEGTYQIPAYFIVATALYARP